MCCTSSELWRLLSSLRDLRQCLLVSQQLGGTVQYGPDNNLTRLGVLETEWILRRERLREDRHFALEYISIRNLFGEESIWWCGRKNRRAPRIRVDPLEVKDSVDTDETPTEVHLHHGPNDPVCLFGHSESTGECENRGLTASLRWDVFNTSLSGSILGTTGCGERGAIHGSEPRVVDEIESSNGRLCTRQPSES